MDRLECEENADLHKGKQNGSTVIVYSSFYAFHAFHARLLRGRL